MPHKKEQGYENYSKRGGMGELITVPSQKN